MNHEVSSLNRPATADDFPFVTTLAPGLQRPVFQRHVAAGRMQVIDAASAPVGFMKHDVLWETLPFLEIIMLVASCRGHGIGRRAVAQWEAEMAGQGHRVCAVSTQVNESAQHFWRKIGYTDCGVLTLPHRPTELFLFKSIG